MSFRKNNRCPASRKVFGGTLVRCGPRAWRDSPVAQHAGFESALLGKCIGITNRDYEEGTMARKRDVRKQDFLIDLRAGMADRELMKKYKLTPRGLGTLFRNLVNAKVLTFGELLSRSGGQLNLPEVVAEYRIRSREKLEFLLPISDSEQPENTGLLYDITDDGVGARGLEARVGEVKTLIIPADDYFRAEPVIFQGICRWVEKDDDRWESGAGFRVLRTLRGDLRELQEIIRDLNPDTGDFSG